MSEGGTNQTPVKKREWIGELLERPEFVEWDRFVVEDQDGTQSVQVYGWIDRADIYKDFVVVRFWPDSETFGFITSSDRYSEELHREWVGEQDLDDHNGCRRVEHAFDVENAVELTEEIELLDGWNPAAGSRDTDHSGVAMTNSPPESKYGDRLADAAKTMAGEADELATRRPHPDAHLYDIESGLRHRVGGIEAFLKEEYYQ